MLNFFGSVLSLRATNRSSQRSLFILFDAGYSRRKISRQKRKTVLQWDTKCQIVLEKSPTWFRSKELLRTSFQQSSSLPATALVFVKIHYSFIHLLVRLDGQRPLECKLVETSSQKSKKVLLFLSMGTEFPANVFLVCVRPVENISCNGWGGVSEG